MVDVRSSLDLDLTSQIHLGDQLNEFSETQVSGLRSANSFVRLPDAPSASPGRVAVGVLGAAASGAAQVVNTGVKAAGLGSRALGEVSRGVNAQGASENIAAERVVEASRKVGSTAVHAPGRVVNMGGKTVKRGRDALRLYDRLTVRRLMRRAKRAGKPLKDLKLSRRELRALRRESKRAARLAAKVNRSGVKTVARASKTAVRMAQRLWVQVQRMVEQLVRLAAKAIAYIMSNPIVAAIVLGVLIFIAIVAMIFAPFAKGGDSGCGGETSVDTQVSDAEVSTVAGHHFKDTYYARGETWRLNADSPLGFAYGNCTDYVAWRLIEDEEAHPHPHNVHDKYSPHLSANGYEWGLPGRLPGWKVVKQASDIRPGDVISYQGNVDYSDPTYGHVAYIAENNGNNIRIQEYANYKYGERVFTIPHIQSEIDNGGVVVKHNAHLPAGASSDDEDASSTTVCGVEQADDDTSDVTVNHVALDPKNTDKGKYQRFALKHFAEHGWASDVDHQMDCLNALWMRESGWRTNAHNPSGAHGIPQALPGSKMGPGWEDDYRVQIKWGLGYIQGRYGNPCGAWAHSQANGWY
ncbi:CHAP domain-containing protein [Aeriscardovia aeriphila]|uniref:Peptidase C51 domain-containing protein n=1 Tax=Aeriscardovia aeriphila TaxID=218139 RepID=A0A261FBJ3_9BIFI|nr:CHAP domain-containing protein [Aeriscardovia aeriphila]NYI25319.1 surface antigen [Aeriscardovia aeriphila]OZG56527.1 hypothetical protein AEAE_1015 [Aeriscardovia aeriphila]